MSSSSSSTSASSSSTRSAGLVGTISNFFSAPAAVSNAGNAVQEALPIFSNNFSSLTTHYNELANTTREKVSQIDIPALQQRLNDTTGSFSTLAVNLNDRVNPLVDTLLPIGPAIAQIASNVGVTTTNISRDVNATTNTINGSCLAISTAITTIASTFGRSAPLIPIEIGKIGGNVAKTTGIINEAAVNISNNTASIADNIDVGVKFFVETLKKAAWLSIALVGMNIYSQALQRYHIPIAEDPCRQYQKSCGIGLTLIGAAGLIWQISKDFFNKAPKPLPKPKMSVSNALQFRINGLNIMLLRMPAALAVGVAAPLNQAALLPVAAPVAVPAPIHQLAPLLGNPIRRSHSHNNLRRPPQPLPAAAPVAVPAPIHQLAPLAANPIRRSRSQSDLPIRNVQAS